MKQPIAVYFRMILGSSFHRFLERIRKIELVGADKKGHLVFLFGLAIFLFFRVNFLAAPMAERDAPIEVDDAYSYIVKAAILEDCFSQDCAALEDLQNQFLTPSNEVRTAGTRLRQYFRVFENYQLLHSGILVGLHSLGLSLEKSFETTVILGAIFLVFAIAYWLYITWGPGGAGITLAALSLITFKGQGLHVIIPSNLSLGLALFTWALIANKSKRLNILFPLIIFLMVSMHRVGFIYAVLSIGLYVFHDHWPISRKPLTVLVASLIIIIGFFVFQMNTVVPELFFSPDVFFPISWSPLSSLKINLITGWDGISNLWGKANWIKLLFGSLILIGFSSLNLSKRKYALKLGAALITLFLISMIYVTAIYQGELTRRVWIPLAIFLSGAVGRVIWIWLYSFFLVFQNLKRKGASSINNAFLSKYFQESGIIWLSLLVLILIIYSYSSNGWLNGFHYSLTLDNSTTRQSFSLNEPQLLFITSDHTEVRDILYMDEISLYFYLSNGALDKGAVFYPAIKNSPDLVDTWISNNTDITHLVAMNPIRKLPIQFNAHLQLTGGIRLRVINENSLPVSAYELYLENSTDRDISLAIEYIINDEKEIQVIEISANTFDWYGLPGNEITNIDSFVLTSRAGRQILNLHGIRPDPDQELSWPWDSGIRLIIKDSDLQKNSFVVDFSTSGLGQNLDLPLTVVDDSGSIVLMKVEKSQFDALIP